MGPVVLESEEPLCRKRVAFPKSTRQSGFAMASLDMGSLYAASSVIATDCSEVNYAFLQCKKNQADPEACLTQGSAVIACTSAT